MTAGNMESRKGTETRKPTLAEIANMPFPASVNAMRKHYNPNWGIPVPEGAEDLREYKVKIEYTFKDFGIKTYTVQAFSEDEARTLAESEWEKDRTIEDGSDIYDSEVSEVTQ